MITEWFLTTLRPFLSKALRSDKGDSGPVVDGDPSRRNS